MNGVYLERRDDAFGAKMAEVLYVYREVALLKGTQAADTEVADICYDEKPGLQAHGGIAPDPAPKPDARST